jgi:hypothetical protein
VYTLASGTVFTVRLKGRAADLAWLTTIIGGSSESMRPSTAARRLDARPADEEITSLEFLYQQGKIISLAIHGYVSNGQQVGLEQRVSSIKIVKRAWLVGFPPGCKPVTEPGQNRIDVSYSFSMLRLGRKSERLRPRRYPPPIEEGY